MIHDIDTTTGAATTTEAPPSSRAKSATTKPTEAKAVAVTLVNDDAPALPTERPAEDSATLEELVDGAMAILAEMNRGVEWANETLAELIRELKHGGPPDDRTKPMTNTSDEITADRVMRDDQVQEHAAASGPRANEGRTR